MLETTRCMRMEGLEICRGSGFGERERERARPLNKKDLLGHTEAQRVHVAIQ